MPGALAHAADGGGVNDAATDTGLPPTTLDGGRGDAGHAADGGGDGSMGATDATVDANGSIDPVRSTKPGLRVAILGDQAVNDDARAVLRMVRAEGAQMVIHAGDIGYDATPAAWDAQIDAELGRDFPYFAVVGNHEAGMWYGAGNYQALLAARLARVPSASCDGDLGVNARCSFQGLSFVLSGVGTLGVDHEAFLDGALATDDVFRLCVWHKNQHDMQTEAKTDEVGWGAYQICQTHGAPIFTGHAHSYSRTYALADVGNKAALHGMFGDPDRLVLSPGSTAVWVTALGGMSIRNWNGESAPWWASIYTGKRQLENDTVVGSSPSIEFGAILIDFHVDGDPYKARGYFKTTSGQIKDRFELRMER